MTGHHTSHKLCIIPDIPLCNSLKYEHLFHRLGLELIDDKGGLQYLIDPFLNCKLVQTACAAVVRLELPLSII